jgi:hypothetical protein
MLASTALPKKVWKKMFRNTGSNSTKPAPRKEPRIVPMPPMMIMNRMRNDNSIVKAEGSTDCR